MGGSGVVGDLAGAHQSRRGALCRRCAGLAELPALRAAAPGGRAGAAPQAAVVGTGRLRPDLGDRQLRRWNCSPWTVYGGVLASLSAAGRLAREAAERTRSGHRAAGGVSGLVLFPV